uniref:EF-hand calcium-binding domain-containing protein 11-like n=1 Tax=Phallusia mammillata TaxID=59560 RepID=A0A6F9DC76_9ASCI|nr:EF-hand calcium-binding domain-containing protein 11-like [Phallusia mammillata]
MEPGETAFLEKVFRMCDETQKGFLSREDLKVAVLYLFGYKPSKHEVSQLLKTEHSSLQTPGMTVKSFQQIMARKLQALDDEQDIREKFQMFDIRCQGYLTLEDVKQAFRLVAPNISDETVNSCYKSICANNNGKLSFRDFQLAMHNNFLTHNYN